MTWKKESERHALASKGVRTKTSRRMCKGILESGLRYEKNADLEGAMVFHARSGPPEGKEQIAIHRPNEDVTYYFERYDVSPVENDDLLAGNGFDKVFEMPYGKYGIFSKEIWVGWMDKDLESIEEPRFFVAVRVPYESKDYKTKWFRFTSSIDNWGPEHIIDEMKHMTEWKKIPKSEEWND
ncbi:hypothetical protein AKJ51_01480 [candidate division MSBL1 archaeon SCGC-AAA382A20]|uniref:Uncharacterized protein n=1 Tax=candidate division MSBL1 archaeon SCGC-AAA382A20 TaxID=1698280 RepID=A0A133VLS0_9EURY|nr:hypothetical protein AKJ51_01480 [candidate division MSBL1 archaeon SCGC-AAA382A20]